MFNDPNWPRANTLLRTDLSKPDIVVAGFPINQSISPGRCDLAPDAVREALRYFSTWTGSGDLLDLAVLDLGNVESLDAVPDLGQKATIFLGGDNNVTRFGVPWMGVPLDRVGLVTLDAHFDLRDRSNGDHNGTPVRALLDAGLPGEQIYQIGIQPFANSSSYAQIANDARLHNGGNFSVEKSGAARPGWFKFPAEFEVTQYIRRDFPTYEAIYVDFDIDVIDRAACPGAPGARPGGISARQFLDCCHVMGAMSNVRACDFVEFDPERDINQVTAMTIASGMLHFMAGVMDRS